ncbi:aldo/keto reductase [Roseobacter litoralis]|uniref:aldo/keto reductase n=1 Tax=Roseobacter litoralis TaxID=42443 RepID=UPI002491F6DF|nr:aldo/keto reductase [Roseobacter litoralis]
MNIYFKNTNQRSFGTYPLKGAACRDAILTAAEVCYRAFDTAQMYRNEAETGAALKETGIPRDTLCVTTKVENDNFDEGNSSPLWRQA